MANPPPRKLHSIQFNIIHEDGRRASILAPLDEHGNGQHLVPAHPDKGLLDVKAGDVLIHLQKTRMTVVSVQPYRTSEHLDDGQYSEITCGADWEAGCDT